MRGAWTIARKDVRQRLRDRSAYVVGIVVPLALVLLMGSVFSQEGAVPTFAVAAEDTGPTARGFGAMLGDLAAEGLIELRPESRSQAEVLVRNGSVSAAFVIPPGFSAAVAAGEPAELIVVVDPADDVGANVAAGIASGYLFRLDADRLAVATVAALGGGPVAIANLETAAAPTGLVRPAGGAGVDLPTHLAFGMAIFFLFFTVQFGILGLIEERSGGTMTRLTAAPIRPAAILAGKVFASFLVGAGSVAVIVVGTSLPPLRIDWGDPAGVAVVTVVGVLAAIGIVALIAGFAKTSAEAMGYTTFAAVLLGILGGAFGRIPAGGWLDTASRFTPHRWLLDGYRGLSVGESIPDVLPAVAVALAIAVVAGSLGVLRFRRMVGSP